jgi:lysozyme family protein
MDWDSFLDFVLDREGRSVHTDHRDPGGQTAWGISRKYHPDWPGWALVDQGESSGPQFEASVRAFYRDLLAPFWDNLKPRIREAVCDAIVNMGEGTPTDNMLGAIELLQHSMNRIAGSTWMTVDGKFGPKTKAAVKTMDPAALAFAFCGFRLAEYADRARKYPSKRPFLSGWLWRVQQLMAAI